MSRGSAAWVVIGTVACTVIAGCSHAPGSTAGSPPVAPLASAAVPVEWFMASDTAVQGFSRQVKLPDGTTVFAAERPFATSQLSTGFRIQQMEGRPDPMLLAELSPTGAGALAKAMAGRTDLRALAVVFGEASCAPIVFGPVTALPVAYGQGDPAAARATLQRMADRIEG